MRFKVPQDVQREDTIIGPITLKQLIILGAGGSLAYAIYILLSKDYFIEVWLIPVAIISIITISFAFIKVHELKFYYYILHLLEFFLIAKQRSWKQGAGEVFISELTVIPQTKKQKEEEANPAKEELKQQKIKKLSEILDKHPF